MFITPANLPFFLSLLGRSCEGLGVYQNHHCISLATMDCNLDRVLQQTIFLLSCLCELFYHHSRERKTSLIHNSLSLSFLHIDEHSQCWEVGQQVILREVVLPSIGHIHGFPRPSSCYRGACSSLQPSLADFQSHQTQKWRSTPWLQPKLTTVRIQYVHSDIILLQSLWNTRQTLAGSRLW